jgi:hypothetical protein
MSKRRSDNDPDAMVIRLCRTNKWNDVLQHLEQNPSLATARIIMDNHIATTIIHQAINSKSDNKVREHVIMTILRMAPQAASIRNGYNSLPLHVICQRNTKMDSQTKERLILALIQAYPESLVEAGGVGQRTPLHIIFTDYTSPALVRHMIEMAPRACFMRDKNGWLPIHVACSRHCSPEKLRLLLDAYPASLHETVPSGETLLKLAKDRATKSHPNYALINELNRFLEADGGIRGAVEPHPAPAPLVEHRDDDFNLNGGQVFYAAGAEVAMLEPIPVTYPVTTTHSFSFKQDQSPAVETDANLLLQFHRTAQDDLRDDGGDDGEAMDVSEDAFDGEVVGV